MAKRILYISYDGLTDQLGQSQILPYIVNLSDKYNFTIISAEKPDAYKQKKEQIEQICKKHNIRWYPVSYTKKPPILSTVRDIKKIRKLAYKLHQEQNFDIVHCRSYIAAIIGQKMKQKYGIKFVFDMRGFWADERLDGKIWNKNKRHYRMVYNYFKKKEKHFFENADAIISLTHKGKQILQNEWKVKNDIYVIPCATDIDLFKPKGFAKKTSESLTIAYLGSIGTWYMLDEMLDFFKVLLEKYPKSKFKFITKEIPASILNKAIARDIDLEHFIVKQADRQSVPKELEDVDLGIFFIKPVFSKNASSPVKQGEFMSMGIPIISNKGIGDTDEIVNKYNSGVLVSEFTTEEYRKVVDKIPDILQLDRKKIRDGAIDYFSLNKGVDSYDKVYRKL